jgi:uncharacterized membrane protein YphA (DoxX/SURF4 family)
MPIMKLLTYISRIIVGSLFTISGLIKANDPLGFSYKLNDYFAPDVLNLEFLIPFALPLAIFIAVAEILLGIAALMGAKSKLTAWSLLLMILFFTWLTFYSAYYNKVTDCGCFGDALKLTPWQSFYKDVVLLFFILIIFLNKSRITYNSLKENQTILPISIVLIAVFSMGMLDWFFPVIFILLIAVVDLVLKIFLPGNKTENLVAIFTLLLTSYFTYYTYSYLPVKDYRPYAIGKSIPDQMKLPEGAQPDIYENKFFYKNLSTGEIEEFSEGSYPWNDDNYEFHDRKTTLVKKGDEAPIKDFVISDSYGGDVTDDILYGEGYYFLVIAYDLDKTSDDGQNKMYELAVKAMNDGHEFIGVTASGESLVNKLTERLDLYFTYYSADETMLKTIVRSNPGLIILKEGKVVGKWHFNTLPEYEEIKTNILK